MALVLLPDAAAMNSTINEIRQGLPMSQFKNISVALDLASKDLAKILQLSPRTFDRRVRSGTLTASESDRLDRLAILLARAIEVFGRESTAKAWLATRLDALAGETPMQHSDTTAGTTEALDLLGRIQWGVFS